MRLELLFALRYLFSRKSTNAINIISMISMVGMGIGALVLVLLLSVFNGFEDTILKLYNSFYTDLVISPANGKTFKMDEPLNGKISGTEGIELYSLTLSENVYLEHNNNDYIGTLKGVDENFARITNIDSFIVSGHYLFQDSIKDYAFVGSGIAMALNILTERNVFPIKIHVPKRGKIVSMMPQNAFSIGYLYPSGIFNLQQEINKQYIIADIGFVRKLLDYESEVSSVEIRVSKGYRLEDVKQLLQNDLGDQYTVKTRFEQQAALYQVLKTEKWTVFALLSFIIFVISFNILGALSMLIIEKHADISILKSLGATNSTIKRIFFFQGVIMSSIGGLVGVFAGFIICLLQINYGFIQIPGNENFVIDAYPVKLIVTDFLLVIACIVVISAIASWIPSSRATRIEANFREA